MKMSGVICALDGRDLLDQVGRIVSFIRWQARKTRCNVHVDWDWLLPFAGSSSPYLYIVEAVFPLLGGVTCCFALEEQLLRGSSHRRLPAQMAMFNLTWPSGFTARKKEST
jgi:hypothetical protein